MQGVIEAIDQAIAAGDSEGAEAAAMAALAGEPDHTTVQLKLVQCLAKQLRFREAISHCLQIIDGSGASLSDRIEAIRVFAICATQVGMPEIARPYVDRIDLRSSPHPSDRCIRPQVLCTMGLAEEAMAELRALSAECPDDPFIAFTLGVTLLQLGDPEGYALADAFSSRACYRTYYPHTEFLERMWEGGPLDGLSIAILPHGGFGDYFQNIRYVPQLRRLGAGRITAVIAPRCHGLILSAGVDAAVTTLEEAGSDCWVGAYGLARAGAVSPGVYFRAPPSPRADAVLQEMSVRAAGRPRIGLYWHSEMHMGEAKSIQIDILAPLFARTDIHRVILQRGFGLRAMQAAGFGRDDTVLPEDFTFDETGAVIAGLDGIATICAWPFHLSGALGIRTWMLAGRVLDGRHLNRERESVLYPGCASIARQPTVGDWPGAIALLMKELDTLAPP